MQLTLRTDYAFRTLLYLAVGNGKPVAAATIARSFGISNAHLVKVVQALSGSGFVVTRAGRNGGVTLGKEPEEIIVGAVVRALEPHMALVECMGVDRGNCKITTACGLSGPLVRAREAFLGVLDEYTLQDCLGDGGLIAELLSIDDSGVRKLLTGDGEKREPA